MHTRLLLTGQLLLRGSDLLQLNNLLLVIQIIRQHTFTEQQINLLERKLLGFLTHQTSVFF